MNFFALSRGCHTLLSILKSSFYIFSDNFFRSFSSNSLEDVIHKGVHDAHGLAGNSSVRVDLLQHLVDVDGVGLPPPPFPLLVSTTGSLSLAGGLLCSFACGLGRHLFVCSTKEMMMENWNRLLL